MFMVPTVNMDLEEQEGRVQRSVAVSVHIPRVYYWKQIGTMWLIGSRFIQMDREITEMRKLTKRMEVGMDYC